jgi:hypothetical protein
MSCTQTEEDRLKADDDVGESVRAPEPLLLWAPLSLQSRALKHSFAAAAALKAAAVALCSVSSFY